jgi:hypothetical protein
VPTFPAAKAPTGREWRVASNESRGESFLVRWLDTALDSASAPFPAAPSPQKPPLPNIFYSRSPSPCQQLQFPSARLLRIQSSVKPEHSKMFPRRFPLQLCALSISFANAGSVRKNFVRPSQDSLHADSPHLHRVKYRSLQTIQISHYCEIPSTQACCRIGPARCGSPCNRVHLRTRKFC